MTTTDSSARSTPRPKSRRLDPKGKRALFGSPVDASSDTLRPGAQPTGRSALFSTGPRQPGTVIVECAGCRRKARITVADIAARLLSFSMWLPLPGSTHPHRMRCPSCHQVRWCRIGWTE